MQLNTRITTALIIFGMALTAQAGELVEQRGYRNCVDRIEHELDNQKPKISPVFFMTEASDSLTYYINAAAWVEHRRSPMRAECVTSQQGLSVLAISIEPGRFSDVPEGRVDIEVASAQ